MLNDLVTDNEMTPIVVPQNSRISLLVGDVIVTVEHAPATRTVYQTVTPRFKGKPHVMASSWKFDTFGVDGSERRQTILWAE